MNRQTDNLLCLHGIRWMRVTD